MKNYELERRKWLKEAKKYATRRYPRGCDEKTCFPGEPCFWCIEVWDYMQAMEDHADVLLSDAKECPY